MNSTSFKTESPSDSSDFEGTDLYGKIPSIINFALNVVSTLFAIIGNSLVIAAILKTPSLRSPSTTLLCGLAASDLLVGLVVQPVYIAKEMKEDKSLLRLFYMLSYFSCGVSLWTMTAISLDRFVALYYHLRYVVIVTSSRVLCLLLTAWLLIFLSSGIHFWNGPLYIIIASIFVALCLMTASFCYIGIFRVVRRHQLQIHAQNQAVQSSNTTNNLAVMQIKRSTINTFIFYIFLILCYLPMLYLLICFGFYGKNLFEVYKSFFTILFMNSSLNPILYCWRIRDLRNAVLKTARRVLCLQVN